VLSIQITRAIMRENTPSPEIAKGFARLLTHYQCRWELSLPVIRWLLGICLLLKQPLGRSGGRGKGVAGEKGAKEVLRCVGGRCLGKKTSHSPPGLGGIGRSWRENHCFEM
jgi:hypothetical protein